MIRFERGGWWLPDGEEHLQQWMLKVNKRVTGPGGPRLVYQYHKYEKLLPYVRASRRVAVDIGGHVGLWSWFLARDFERVIAFEPMPEHRACWHENMKEADNAELHPFALGEVTGEVVLRTRTPGSSGDTGVDPAAERSSLRATITGDGDADPQVGIRAELRRLDDMRLDRVDLIKLDCEGYELFALKGAVETLQRCRPALIVEQKPETGFEARYGVTAADCIEFLRGLGAKQRGAIQGDYIFSWDPQP